jgi:hypothetical protein
MTTKCNCKPCTCGPSCRCASRDGKSACACGPKGACASNTQAKTK